MTTRIILLALVALLSAAANAGIKAKTPTVAIFDGGPDSAHEKAIRQILVASLKDCGLYKIKSYPIFQNGKMTEKLFNKAISQAKKDQVDVINLSWNTRYSNDFQNITKSLETLAKKSVLIIAAGENKKEPNQPLKIKDTVAGHIPSAVIVGEATPQGHLALNSNYGPEIHKIIKPPRGLKGSSFSVSKYISQLICNKGFQK